jgi:hypothetical protein
MILKKNLIDKYNQQNNVIEDGSHTCDHNVIEDSSKLKMCCFYNDNNRRYDSIETKLQNKVREFEVEALPSHLLEQSSTTKLSPQRDNKVPEESSTNDNEISRVKNIFKIGTPLPLEPSLYSPIHLLGEKKTN